MPDPSTILTSNSFYDLIANEYNSQIISEQNDRIRKQIADIFINTIYNGTVLDFGGGTGLDIPWMAEHYSRVYFLEPSMQMRSVAKENVKNSRRYKVSFVEENLEFQNWSLTNLPFDEKVDGILANFAVLNCIPDVLDLFKRLSLICKPAGNVVATILDVRWHKLLRRYSLKTFMQALSHKPPIIYNSHKGFGHPTYLHSIRDLKRFYEEHFFLENYIPIKESPFALIILRKK